LIIAFLLFDGRQNESTFGMMNEEGVFPRLLELIQAKIDDDAGLHRMLLELLYEMSRIQRLRIEDLSECNTWAYENFLIELWAVLIEDNFIIYLFELIEGLSSDVNDPYHYPVIRVLVRMFLDRKEGRIEINSSISLFSMNNIWFRLMTPVPTNLPSYKLQTVSSRFFPFAVPNTKPLAKISSSS
jgi:hypothetical protein